MSKLRIAVVDKSPSRANYQKSLELWDYDIETFHMAHESFTGRMLKKHITIGSEDNPFNPDDYDYIILIGAEPFKQFTGRTGVVDYTGKLAEGLDGKLKYLVSINPSQVHFKPEMKPVLDKTITDIEKILSGTAKAPVAGNYKPIQDSDEALEYLKMVEVMTKGPVALDSETSGLYARNCEVLGISVSHQEYQGVYIDADHFDDRCIYTLQSIINQAGRPIVFHNLKFDMHMYMYHFGITFDRAFKEDRMHDTMLMHYVLDERRGTHGLKSLAMQFTDMGDYDFELDQFKRVHCKAHGIKLEDFTYDLIPFEIMWPYAAKDTDATIRLFNFFYPKIQANQQFMFLYHELLMPACRFLQRVEDRGVPISKDRLVTAQELLTNQLNELTEKLYSFEEVMQYEEIKGAKFNPNSPIQLRELLFDVLGLEPTGKLTGTGAISTDAETLEKVSSQHPVAKILLNIRKTSKLLSTYVEKLLVSIDTDGCVRTGFNQHMTTSGRLSSSGKLNLQQLPRDESIIKACITAPRGYRVVAHDLTTAEIYFAAVLSKDKNMQQVFINMKNDPKRYPDFHANIAHMVFKLDCEPNQVKDLYPALRQAAKAISFGILYGSGPAKVAEAVNMALLEQSINTGEPFVPCTKEDALDYIDTYFSSFPELRRWIESSHSQIEQFGFIYSHFGRKRRLPNVTSDDKGVRAGEVRSGFNAIIQGASSDVLLLGAIDADKEIASLGLEKEMKIIMLVHDSVVAIVREDLVDQYNELVVRNIQKDRGISIKDCPIGVGQDSEDNGSVDYSCGKVKGQHPEIAVLNDEAYLNKLIKELETDDLPYSLHVLGDKTNTYYDSMKSQLPVLAKIVKDCKQLKTELNSVIGTFCPHVGQL